ncbi:hypothetical protein NE857_06635 [Nocardiopsis exhalans]|uniref:Uncharacterized protein n=1 Tax=Nocardiopsis exhalans TaxID=163604 RepID=A0ABY5DC01_9ACTN|nr:hypothetical protein [Nocardiopsis exhalans]USY21291.1 hypothetical protein NE857_06635 [Nocardiopsis exhalans]
MLFLSVGVYAFIIWVLLAYYIGENEWHPEDFAFGVFCSFGVFSGAHLRSVAERDLLEAIRLIPLVRPAHSGAPVNHRTPGRPRGAFYVIYFTRI